MTLNKYLDTLVQLQLVSEECRNLVLATNRWVKKVFNKSCDCNQIFFNDVVFPVIEIIFGQHLVFMLLSNKSTDMILE